MQKMVIRFTYIIATILMIGSLFYLAKYYHAMHKEKQETNLLNEISIEENITKTEEILESKEIIYKTERMLKLEELQKENSDIIGWIEIEDTNINYPVLQGLDNDYYMNHDYQKKRNMIGSIFLDKDYIWDPPSSNLLIYGHNIKNGTMFQNLLNYREKTYYEQHPNIRFTTKNEDVYYEIIAAFSSKVYHTTDQNVFRYYYFINAQNEVQYNEFVQNVKKASLYDTLKTAVYGDQLMTLSTCAYHVQNGRFAIVAKKGTPVEP